ncbi:PASTA domain-containing protein [Arthrobacter sp. TMN-37]
MNNGKRIALWVSAVVVALLLLAGAFLLGQSRSGDNPDAGSTDASPRPTVTTASNSPSPEQAGGGTGGAARGDSGGDGGAGGGGGAAAGGGAGAGGDGGAGVGGDGGAGAGAGGGAGGDDTPPPALVPPGLIGSVLVDAQNALAAEGITSAVAEEVASADQIGLVVAVTPNEGEPLPEDRNVTLTVGAPAQVTGDITFGIDDLRCHYGGGGAEIAHVLVTTRLLDPQPPDLLGQVTITATGDNGSTFQSMAPVGTGIGVQIAMRGGVLPNDRFIDITLIPDEGLPNSNEANDRIRVSFTLHPQSFGMMPCSAVPL